MFESCDAIGKERSIRSGIFAAGKLVPLVHMEEGVSVGLQILREPLRIRKRCALIEAEVIRCPTPPADRRSCRDPGMMQIADETAIGFELIMVIVTDTKYHP